MPRLLRSLLPLVLCLAPLATALDPEECIRPGRPLPDLGAEPFLPLNGYPPSLMEWQDRVVVLVLFQAGTEGELDLALDLLEKIEALAPGEILLTLGVATCLDVQRDALSLDDSFITTMIETGGHANLRIVRDRHESLWPRVLVHSASGYRRGTPSVVIVDRKGMVFTTCFVASRKHQRRCLRALQAALALAVAPDRGAHHPRVQPAANAYSRDHLGEAARMAEGLLEDDDPEVVSSAAQLLGLIQIRYDAEMSRAESLVEEGRVNAALEALEELRRDFGSHELAEEARERRENLLEDPALQEERKADRALSRLLAEVERRDLSGSATRRLLAGRLRRLADRYDGTRSAGRARVRAEELDPTGDGE